MRSASVIAPNGKTNASASSIRQVKGPRIPRFSEEPGAFPGAEGRPAAETLRRISQVDLQRIHRLFASGVSSFVFSTPLTA